MVTVDACTRTLFSDRRVRCQQRRIRGRTLATFCAGGGSTTRVWHCPPPAEERTAKQAASTLSKLPPHILGAGGLDPATQSPQNQQAYLGSLAERFLPVDLSYRGLRVLNVDPPIFAIPNFIEDAECDALAAFAADAAAGPVENVKNVNLGDKMPAPIGDGMPALAQRLGELVEDAQRFVRCDGAWFEGTMMNNWGMTGGFAKPLPPGAFAFEMPTLSVVAKGEQSHALADAFEREAANDMGFQRRAVVRIFLTNPPAEVAAKPVPESEVQPDIDRDAFVTKFTICDIGVSPAKGTAIVTFPSFSDGMPDERVLAIVKASTNASAVWLDLPVSIGLEDGGIAAPISMADVGTVEKVGEEGNIGTAARDKNRQAWRANISRGEGGHDVEVAEEVKKKLDELKDTGL